MKVTVVKELNIQELYNNIMAYDGFAEYNACEESGLTGADFTHKLMSKILNALADEADRRANEED